MKSILIKFLLFFFWMNNNMVQTFDFHFKSILYKMYFLTLALMNDAFLFVLQFYNLEKLMLFHDL